MEETVVKKRRTRYDHLASAALGLAAGMVVGFIFATIGHEDSSLRVAENCVTNIENARAEAELCDLWVEDGYIVMGPQYLNPEYTGPTIPTEP